MVKNKKIKIKKDKYLGFKEYQIEEFVPFKGPNIIAIKDWRCYSAFNTFDNNEKKHLEELGVKFLFV